MRETVAFFEAKGKKRLKDDDRDRVWYQDFLDFQRERKIFATLLTPRAYGGPEARWDTWRNCEMNEILGFYGLCYWYTWQVTILGLGPFWMSRNEAMKQRVARLLDQGGIFGFGLSEKSTGRHLSVRCPWRRSPTAPSGPTGGSTTSATATRRRCSRSSERWREQATTSSSRRSRKTRATSW
jgi:hypothetical protein